FGASMICFMLGFIFFPMTFIYGGGINGDAPIWFVYSILVVSILLDGKQELFSMFPIFLLRLPAIISTLCTLNSWWNHPE
ncbi:MAG: hypothetical protein IKZ39_02090, partial [Lachnospiraceae bacterium]|nr:hypothetical protein [Lachnospiraceae bacterium]